MLYYLAERLVKYDITELLLISLILFSPLLYGSVTILPLSIIEIISFILLLICLMRPAVLPGNTFIKIPYLPVFLFSIIILFQLLPLPELVIKLLSPATASAYKNFSTHHPCFYSLSINPDKTAEAFIQILCFLSIFFAAINYVDSESKGRRIITVIIIAGFFYSMLGIVYKPTGAGISFSTFVNKNHFAAYLGMMIPIAVAYSFVQKSFLKQLFLIFIAWTESIALLLTASRAGIVSFLIGVLILFFMLQKKISRGKLIFIGGLLFLILITFMVFAGFGETAKKIATLMAPFNVMSDRIVIVRDSMPIFFSFPIFGTGLGTFGSIFSKYKTFDSVAVFSFAHNEFLQLLIETGLLGILCLVNFLKKYIRNALPLWFERRDPYAVYCASGLFAGMVSIAVHSFFDFVFHVPANLVLFFIIMSLAYRTVYLNSHTGNRSVPVTPVAITGNRKKFYIVAVIAVFIFMEGLVIRRCAAHIIFESVYNKNVFELKKKEMMLNRLDSAIRLNPINSEYHAYKGDILMDIFSSDSSKESAALKNDAENSYLRAICLNPLSSSNHMKLSRFYYLTNNRPAAEAQMQKAHTLDPKNETIRMFLENLSYSGVTSEK